MRDLEREGKREKGAEWGVCIVGILEGKTLAEIHRDSEDAFDGEIEMHFGFFFSFSSQKIIQTTLFYAKFTERSPKLFSMPKFSSSIEVDLDKGNMLLINHIGC